MVTDDVLRFIDRETLDSLGMEVKHQITIGETVISFTHGLGNVKRLGNGCEKWYFEVMFFGLKEGGEHIKHVLDIKPIRNSKKKFFRVTYAGGRKNES